MKLIDKDALVAEINNWIKDARRRYTLSKVQFSLSDRIESLENLLSFIDTFEVKEVGLELENENNKPKITTGTKIRSKTNPNVILSIISNDCHEDEYECSNGSVLSLKQIEKYYDLII